MKFGGGRRRGRVQSDAANRNRAAPRGRPPGAKETAAATLCSPALRRTHPAGTARLGSRVLPSVLQFDSLICVPVVTPT